MNAAVLYGKEQIRVENVPERTLQPGEVRIQIEAALTCGTDLKVYKRGYHARMIVPPALFGHELAGVLSEVQDHSAPWQVGERVGVANSAPCGECFCCRNHQGNLCDDLLFLNGAYAEFIVVPARIVQKNLLRLKPETPFCDAALIEPLACVVQGIEDMSLRPDQRVLVLGAGPIGLMFTALATHSGCDVTVVGRGAPRLAAANALGATQTIQMHDGEDVAKRVHEAAKGQFEAVIEAVGKPETWEASVQLVRKGGVVNFFGGCPSGTSVKLDTTLIHYSNLTLLASFHHTPKTIRRALEFIEGGIIRSKDFVDGECPLSKLPELFASMAAGNHAVKTLIQVKE
jgi:L-iditol 2-dehydrogenase